MPSEAAVRGWLEGLGADEAAVAARLLALGVRGRRGVGEADPIGLALRQRFPEVTRCGVGHQRLVFVAPGGAGCVPLPWPCRLFEFGFDRGDYPALDAGPVAWRQVG